MDIGLLDGNNFFVSCEQVFQPKLLGQPVIVLSNNGGCVIARSPQAKALGIAMGVPFFKIQELVKDHHVQVLSSNFELYQDMHRRMMMFLKKNVKDVHVYSVDEAFFLSPEKDQKAREALGQYLKTQIQQRMGLPVSIGFGPTKTLAKAANYFAKRLTFVPQGMEGVVDLSDGTLRPLYLKNLPIGEVWGIGRQYTKFLENRDIKDAWTFCQQATAWVDRHMTIVGRGILQELQGTPFFDFEESHEAQKSLTVSRSFGHGIGEFKELKEAVCFFAIRASQKLRKQNLKAGKMTLSLVTKERTPSGFLTFQTERVFENPTYLTLTVVQMALSLLQELWQSPSLAQKGYIFRKAGVHFYELESDDGLHQGDFFKNSESSDLKATTQAMDQINQRFGRNTLFYGAQGLAPTWAHAPVLRSPRWTTRIEELLVVG